MKLSHQDAQLFYDLMWKLQFYAKERLQLLPEITTIEEYAPCSFEDKSPVRAKLFEQRELIDDFVTENPHKLPNDHLQIIQPWKEAVTGDFYVERMLKRYTIFVATDNSVYGVLGLYDDFDDIFHKSRLPFLGKTVLLPFKGKIIYDGFLEGYNMFFGGGIKGRLKEAYLSAKQNGRIIESLGGSAVSDSPKISLKSEKNWRPELDALAAGAQKLRGGSDQPVVYSPTFSLIKASIELGQMAAANSQDAEQLWESFEKVNRSLHKLEKTLERMD